MICSSVFKVNIPTSKHIGFTMVKPTREPTKKKLNEAERVVYSNFLNECKISWEKSEDKNIWGVWLNEMNTK